MSGGHWGYKQHRIEEAADYTGSALRLLAAIEHELDWGVSGDTCLKCAEIRVAAALLQFFEDDHERTALSVLRDRGRSDLRCARDTNG